MIITNVIGIDIGKNSFHVVGLDRKGAIVLRQKWSRSQVGERLANIPACLIGIRKESWSAKQLRTSSLVLPSQTERERPLAALSPSTRSQI